MSRTYKRDRDGTHQLTDFAARLNRTKYSDKPTPNRRNQRRNSSDFSPARYMANGPDACDKPDATEAYHSKLDHADTGFQVIRGRTRNMHFMPHWTPIRVFSGMRVTWLPERSDWVTAKERELAKIAVMLEAGQDVAKISRRLRIPRRTTERRIAYLLSSKQDREKSGGQNVKTGALVEEGAVLAMPAAKSRNPQKEKSMPAKKSKITPFEPVTIELTVRQRPDGRIAFSYSGADDRTPIVGEFVLDAIIAAIDAL